MKAGIFTNLYRDTDLSVTRALIAALDAAGVECLLCRELGEKIAGYGAYSQKNRPDFMLSVGGDGTILRVAKYCAELNVPVLGINLGHTGFLAEVEPGDVARCVAALRSGDYTTDKRSLIDAEVNGRRFSALNDVVLSRAPGARMIETEVFVGGEFVDKYRCDGFIVSTPTGSTAYSLSAGGSILSPSVAAFILTPLNSHSLHSRPIVVSDGERVRLVTSGAGEASLVVDGTSVLDVAGKTKIDVTKSDKSVSFVRLGGGGFYKRLLVKLNKWSTTDKED